MDFSLEQKLQDDVGKARQFVRNRLLPLEKLPQSFDEHENIRLGLLNDLRNEVKALGLWAPQMPVSLGGLGYGPVGMAALYEQMNYSIFGPVCFNCAAPDDGNMYILNKVGTEEQKQIWLQPIVSGDARSSFAMTEPAPGGGSDPGMIRTTAERVGSKWVINGTKWYITGAGVASHFIVLARTGVESSNALTAFLFHRDEPGWAIKRRIGIMGPEEHGGHCELIFDGLELDESRILLGEGQGLKVAQIRLGLARLTHCMRWLGLAQRAIDIASAYASDRSGFGMKLIDRESIRLKLGKAAMDIETGRVMTMRAAWRIEQGSKARQDVSIAKIIVSELLNRVVSDAIQICGAKGYSKDLVLEWMFRYGRQALLVDGSTEVHEMVISNFMLKDDQDFWCWGRGAD